jgi:hypothetical protein
MVIEVTTARHPEGAGAGHQPSGPGGQQALRIVHQYLFHDKLRFLSHSVL